MGLKDPYPFVLSAPTIAKLRLVQQILARASEGEALRAAAERGVDVAFAASPG